MVTYKFWKYIKLSGLCLMISVLSSCTYDYFQDENNFLLYVPQVKDQTITRFYVAFHSEDGTHVLTREITAPFFDPSRYNDVEKLKEGILRFKLPPGRNYTISCFADYAPGSISVGNPFGESSQTKTLDTSEENVYVRSENVYESRTTHPRSLFLTATAYPIGHPDSQKPVEANIDETRFFKGDVILSFIDLPDFVSRIDTYYSGLSTAYHFDGTFRNFSYGDRIRGSYDRASNQAGNVVETDDPINPSAGTYFGMDAGSRSPSSRAGVLSPTPVPLELEIQLYDDFGNMVGVIPFTQADFENLSDDKKPVDENGNPVTSLVLESQESIKFTFKGFTVIKIEVAGWGGVSQGGTTPM